MAHVLFRVEQELSAPNVTLQLRQSVWEEAGDLEVTMATYTLTTMVSGMGAWAKSGHGSSSYKAFFDLGHIYYLPKDTPLVIRPKKIGTNRHLACIFMPEIVDHIGLGAATNENPLRGSNIETRAVKSLINLMSKELFNPGFASQLLIDSLGLSLGIELSRMLTERASDQKFKGGLTHWQLRQIRERIADKEDIPTIAEIATLCGMSERHLMRTFKHTTGMTLHQFAEDIRIEKAKYYLQSEMPIKQVAAKLGFQNASNFSAAFKRITSVPPTEFRRNVQKQPATYGYFGKGQHP